MGRFAHPGGILVLHDIQAANPATRRKLRARMPEMQRQGFRFVTLSTLLGPG